MAKVYYFDFSNAEIKNDYKDVLKERCEYISKIFDENRKKQSYFASKLLEVAFNENQVNYSHGIFCENGEWKLRDSSAYFSISHSLNIVVVGISKNRIGVDVEKIDKKVLALEKKYNLDLEVGSIDEKIEEYTKFWVNKEARFKAKVDAKNNLIKVDDSQKNLYFISAVCADDLEFVKINKL